MVTGFCFASNIKNVRKQILLRYIFNVFMVVNTNFSSSVTLSVTTDTTKKLQITVDKGESLTGVAGFKKGVWHCESCHFIKKYEFCGCTEGLSWLVYRLQFVAVNNATTYSKYCKWQHTPVIKSFDYWKFLKEQKI